MLDFNVLLVIHKFSLADPIISYFPLTMQSPLHKHGTEKRYFSGHVINNVFFFMNCHCISINPQYYQVLFGKLLVSSSNLAYLSV